MRPTTVRCACCDTDAPARTAREAQLTWCLSASGAGSHTDPQRLLRLNLWVCVACWKRSEHDGTVFPTDSIRRAVVEQLVTEWARLARVPDRVLF